MIYARVSGYLKTWQQDIGAHVTAGQTLASIDAPDLDQQLAQAKAEVAVAAANERLAAATAKRYSALVADQWISRQAMDNVAGDAAAKKATADSARANVKRLEALESFKTVVAPFDGIVTQRNTDMGALINAGNAAGQELFEVSDLHRVRIYVQVPQAYAADIQPGMKATFEMPQYPGQKFGCNACHDVEYGERDVAQRTGGTSGRQYRRQAAWRDLLPGYIRNSQRPKACSLAGDRVGARQQWRTGRGPWRRQQSHPQADSVGT